MSAPGVAILVAVERDGSEANWDVFREGEDDGLDPVAAAEAMRRHTEPDFPTRLFGIIADDRARELMAERRMRQWGLT